MDDYAKITLWQCACDRRRELRRLTRRPTRDSERGGERVELHSGPNARLVAKALSQAGKRIHYALRLELFAMSCSMVDDLWQRTQAD